MKVLTRKQFDFIYKQLPKNTRSLRGLRYYQTLIPGEADISLTNESPLPEIGIVPDKFFWEIIPIYTKKGNSITEEITFKPEAFCLVN